MRAAVLCCPALALLLPSLVEAGSGSPAGAISGRFGAATVDFSRGTVSIAGAAAADLHAPNAGVARVRAERAARAIAARRLAEAMAQVSTPHLGCNARPAQAVLDAAAARATTEQIEWASDGSVSLVLRIPLTDLAAPSAVAASAGPDGGATVAGVAVLLVQSGEEPTWFREDAGRCAAAPRYFDTVSDARAAGRELAGALLVLSRQTLVESRAAPGSGGPFAPLPRVVGIARRDDTGVGGGAAR